MFAFRPTPEFSDKALLLRRSLASFLEEMGRDASFLVGTHTNTVPEGSRSS